MIIVPTMIVRGRLNEELTMSKVLFILSINNSYCLLYIYSKWFLLLNYYPTDKHIFFSSGRTYTSYEVYLSDLWPSFCNCNINQSRKKKGKWNRKFSWIQRLLKFLFSRILYRHTHSFNFGSFQSTERFLVYRVDTNPRLQEIVCGKLVVDDYFPFILFVVTIVVNFTKYVYLVKTVCKKIHGTL